MSMGSLDQAFRAIESLRDESFRKNDRLVKLEARVDSIERQHTDSAIQLKTTEKRMGDMIDFRHKENQAQLTEIIKDLRELMAEYHRAKGRNQVVNWLPTIISCVIGFSAIATIIRS